MGLSSITNDDSMPLPFDAPLVVVNYFYHSVGHGIGKNPDACIKLVQDCLIPWAEWWAPPTPWAMRSGSPHAYRRHQGRPAAK